MSLGRAMKLSSGSIGVGVMLDSRMLARLEEAVARMRNNYPHLHDDQLVDLIFCFGLDFFELAYSVNASERLTNLSKETHDLYAPSR